MRMPNVESWNGRLIIFCCLIILPFFRFLLQNHYSLLRLEVVASITSQVVVCLLLATVSLRKPLFYGMSLSVIVFMSALPTEKLLDPIVHVRLIWCVLLISLALVVLAWKMEERFFTVLFVFTLSAFAMDVVLRFTPDRTVSSTGVELQAAHSQPLRVLYIIFDEQIGPAGFPKDIPEARAAAAEIDRTFSRWDFRLYPNAYSNYAMTLDSIPSILNSRLLEHPREYFMDQSHEIRSAPYSLRQNKLFATYAARGFQIHVYQNRALDYSHGNVPVNATTEYWDSLEELSWIQGPWSEKLHWIVGNYQGSDPFLNHLAAFFPFRFGSRGVGPLGLSRLWPHELARDIVQAKEPTLFFAHLFTPHRPYVYAQDGSYSDFEEWRHDEDEPQFDITSYREKYRRYAAQVIHLYGELNWLFQFLQDAHVFDSMQIVIHGDHGSRIRLVPKATNGESEPAVAARVSYDRYDYNSPPEIQDLLDRFSTLLAVKDPGSRHPEHIYERSSVLRFLEQEIYHSVDSFSEEENSVYLYDDDKPHRIALPELIEAQPMRDAR